MALEFPAAPIDGEIHLASNNVAYQWEAAKTKWITRLAPSEGGITNPGPNPPANPNPGTLWFNTDEGRLYNYYDDGDSQQWVDVTGT